MHGRYISLPSQAGRAHDALFTNAVNSGRLDLGSSPPGSIYTRASEIQYETTAVSRLAVTHNRGFAVHPLFADRAYAAHCSSMAPAFFAFNSKRETARSLVKD